MKELGSLMQCMVASQLQMWGPSSLVLKLEYSCTGPSGDQCAGFLIITLSYPLLCTIMASASIHRDQWENILKADQARTDFVAVGMIRTMYKHRSNTRMQSLLNELEISQTKLAKAEADKERQDVMAEHYFVMNKSLKNNLESDRHKLVSRKNGPCTRKLARHLLICEQESNAFISVLIDGDCMNVGHGVPTTTNSKLKH